MKQIVLFLSIFMLIIRCQATDTTKTRKAIGFSFSPDYCYRVLQSSSNPTLVDQRNSMEIPGFGFTSGLNMSIILNKRFTFEIGFLYASKGEKTEKMNLIFITPEPSAPLNISYIRHYIYLDMPLRVNYQIIRGKLGFFVSAGVSPNLFLTQKRVSVMEYTDGHTSREKSSVNEGFSRINFALTAGLGLNYNISPKLYLKIAPTFRRSITSVIDAPIKGYFYSAGIDIGIYFRF